MFRGCQKQNHHFLGSWRGPLERLHTGISVTLSFKFSLHHLGVKKKNKGVGLRVSFYLFCSGLPWSNTCVSVHWSSCWAAFWLHIWRKDSRGLYVGLCKTTRSPILCPKHASCLNKLVQLRGNFFTATPNGRKEWSSVFQSVRALCKHCFKTTLEEKKSIFSLKRKGNSTLLLCSRRNPV